MNSLRQHVEGYTRAQLAKESYDQAASASDSVVQAAHSLVREIIQSFVDGTLPGYDAFLRLLPIDALTDPEQTFMDELEAAFRGRDFAHDELKQKAGQMISRAMESAVKPVGLAA